MITRTHFVVDLETLDNQGHAAIVSLGIVRIEHGQIRAQMYLRLNLEQGIKHGQSLGYSTVLWWLEQSEEARAELTHPERRHLLPALQEVTQFIREGQTHPLDALVWGNGPGFDCNILRAAFEGAGLPCPWQYPNERCLRTILDLYPEAKALAGDFIGTRHHALHDAQHEARRLVEALKLHSQSVTTSTIRAACDTAIDVFKDEPQAEQCKETAEYMREVLLASTH